MKPTASSISKKERRNNKINFDNIKLVECNNLYFIMNVQNGAVIAIDFGIYEKLVNYFNTLDENNEITEYMIKFEEFGFFENITYERQAYLHVTDRCNLNCLGCYSSIDNRNNFKDISIENIKKIFQELKNHNISTIIYSGGEPTLRKDLSNILRMAKEEFGFINILISNGSKEIDIQVLKYLDELSLSIDDFKSKKNELGRILNYESILNNIEKCKEINLSVAGIITIHQQNIDKIDNYFEVSRKYKLPISFSMFYPTSKDEVYNNQFILSDVGLEKLVKSSLRKMPDIMEGILGSDNIYCRDTCEIGRTSISINSRGELNPCHMIPDIKLGSLIDDAEATWRALELFNQNNIIENKECKSCQYEYFCGGGCRARAYYDKSLKSRDPYCTMYKLYYSELLAEIAQG